MKDPTALKTVLYVAGALIGIASSFLGVGIWIGRKNQDSKEIEELKALVVDNEQKAKARLYRQDGGQIFVRADFCEKFKAQTNKNIKELQGKQQAHELTLGRIDSNVKLLISLFKESK